MRWRAFSRNGLERRLGQPVIIENRPGQGTATGAAYVARSAPDGYTLLAATSSTLAFNPTVYRKLGYDSLARLFADFADRGGAVRADRQPVAAGG